MPALAQEQATVNLLQAATPYKGWRLSSLRLEGVPADLEGPLREGLALTGKARLGGLLGRKRPALTPALLGQDADRIRLFMARHGYPWAVVMARADPRPRRRLDLLLSVLPGPAVHVAELELQGPPEVEAREAELRDLLPAAGDIFTDESLRLAVRKVEDLLRGEGHARARCLTDVAVRDSLNLILACQVLPGPVCRVASVEVSGVAPDLARLAERSLRPLHDQPVTPRLLVGAQDRLRLLGVFRQIRFAMDLDSLPDVREVPVALRAELAPRPPRLLEAGAGWWTAEGGRLGGRWSHANLFTGGRGLQLTASASKVRQSSRLESWWPAMGSPTLRGEIALLLDRLREESYNVLNRELRLGLRQQPTLLLTLSGGVALADVQVEGRTADSTAFRARAGRQTMFTAAALRNTTDNPLDPRQGAQYSLQLEWTIPGFFSQADYLRTDAERVSYHSLGLVTTAARLRVGMAWPLASTPDLLPNRRFFAGGMEHRGFGRHQLGPRDAAGAPLGGEVLALGGVEVRLPLVWKLGLAFFVDAGQVWSDLGGAAPRDLEYAAGPALLLNTPVGPLRADLGLRLGSSDDDLPNWAVHVSIGHPF
ncbi:MAG: BamA/TamA family outer membrane protein [bacterium]|nr:BamA/TamA family outer membrane protein [bacterium]